MTTLEMARKQSPTESWLLIIDLAGKPLGWLDKERHMALRSGVQAHRVLAPVGSELTPDGTLRQALDSALSSPCGQGVVTDAQGAVTGVVSIAQVIDVVEAVRTR
jgi:osmoprotectant transport system ATP-binding protein